MAHPPVHDPAELAKLTAGDNVKSKQFAQNKLIDSVGNKLANTASRLGSFIYDLGVAAVHSKQKRAVATEIQSVLQGSLGKEAQEQQQRKLQNAQHHVDNAKRQRVHGDWTSAMDAALELMLAILEEFRERGVAMTPKGIATEMFKNAASNASAMTPDMLKVFYQGIKGVPAEAVAGCRKLYQHFKTAEAVADELPSVADELDEEIRMKAREGDEEALLESELELDAIRRRELQPEGTVEPEGVMAAV